MMKTQRKINSGSVILIWTPLANLDNISRFLFRFHSSVKIVFILIPSIYHTTKRSREGKIEWRKQEIEWTAAVIKHQVYHPCSFFMELLLMFILQDWTQINELHLYPVPQCYYHQVGSQSRMLLLCYEQKFLQCFTKSRIRQLYPCLILWSSFIKMKARQGTKANSILDVKKRQRKSKS